MIMAEKTSAKPRAPRTRAKPAALAEPFAPSGPCAKAGCVLDVAENSVGGHTVTHPGPRGGTARGFTPADMAEFDPWLARIHAEEAR